MGSKRLPRKSELDQLYGEGWADDAYTSVPCSEEVTLFGPADRETHGREWAPISEGIGAFSFVVVAAPEVQVDLFDDSEQLCMFHRRQAE